jgi:hypothetical protein
MMPGRLDGIDLAHAARLLRPGLQVLFASGFPTLVHDHADQEIRDQVLGKPYRAAELVHAILGLIEVD